MYFSVSSSGAARMEDGFPPTPYFCDVCDAARASEDGQWKTVTLELPWPVRRIKAARSDLQATS